MEQYKQEILKMIRCVLKPLEDKCKILIIGSFIDKDDFDDIDFVVVTSMHRRDIFHRFYLLCIALNKKVDLVVLKEEEYQKFLVDKEMTNTHQVFLPPKKRKCKFLDKSLCVF